ncbi:MAG: RNase H family protein [bacterium]
MKVYVYPAFKPYKKRGYQRWCTILRDSQGHEKILQGQINDLNKSKTYMQLHAINQGLKKLKYPVDIVLYSRKKYVKVAIDDDLFSKWEKQEWLNKKDEDILHKSLWQEMKKHLEKHKSTQCIRATFKDDPFFWKAYQISADMIKYTDNALQLRF